MYPLSDKDLDRMSREASEQNDVDQSPSGWERLEQRLNKELPTKKDKDRRRFLWIFFLTIALSGAGLAYLLIGNQNDTTVSTTDQLGGSSNSTPISSSNKQKSVTDNKTTINSSSIENPAPAAPLAVTETTDKNLAEEQIVTAAEPTKEISPSKAPIKTPSINLADADQKNSSFNSTKQKKSTRLVPTKTKTDIYSLTQSKSKTFKRPNIRKQVEPVDAGLAANSKNNDQDAGTKSPLTVEPTTTVNNSTAVESIQKEEANNNKSNTTPILEAKDTVAQTGVVAAETNKKQDAKTKTPIKNRLAFGVLAGSDFSNINGALKTKAGYSLGVQVSYNLTKKLSVNSGFLFTKKFYKADGSDFHPPKHYFTNYVDKLVSVDGDCFMWEIPVNIRYDLLGKSSFKWYLNAGISSYIMRNQAYTYYYINNNTPASKDWSSQSQQNEWLKIINLSTGIEYAASKNWSLTGEPYLKLPTTGVGFGKMDISSFGILFGLRYYPNFKK